MATLTFFLQTADGSCTIDRYCSSGTTGGANSTSTNRRQATTTSPAQGIAFTNGPSADEIVFAFIEAIPGVGNWAAGNYTVTVNVTGTNMNLALTQIYLCRLSSSCVNQATVGSLTGIGRILSSAESVDHVVSGAAQPGASATDKLLILLVGDNSAMSSQSATLEVTIATPIQETVTTAPPPFGARHRPQFYAPRRRYK